MKSTEILTLMIKDHTKIVKLLTNVKKSLEQDLSTTMKAFDTFEWELEKHIFTEEKTIFTTYNPTNITQGYAMVPELIKEHNELLNTLRVMRKNLIKHHPIDFEDFTEKLMNHKNFEEDTLYPQLDQELTDDQKTQIISRITEIIS